MFTPIHETHTMPPLRESNRARRAFWLGYGFLFIAGTVFLGSCIASGMENSRIAHLRSQEAFSSFRTANGGGL
ncbi:hypothetical protein GGR04_001066 [Aureimonas pseudogalii]|uniref:Uncharacterized protein n=2 Tax=Aureimonas pseudogalii TaxID=1744844 RepID=A0A7W6EEM5_9HYPH|nr:hypothetical protein [Aureimonas pseudogalii]